MTNPVKIPSRDIFNLDNQTFNTAEIEQVLFEEIGGTELINLTRHDTVDGLNVYYSIISDLSKINIEYDASFILTGVSSYERYSSQYPINLFEKIPTDSYIDQNYFGLPDVNIGPNIYVSDDNKVNIEFDALESDRIIQVYFMKNATINIVRENDY